MRKGKLRLIQSSKLETRKLFLVIILLSAFSFQLSAFLIGCAQINRYSLNRSRLAAISSGNLKGMSKVDVVKNFGEPVSTSKSDVSECWFYVRPKSIWIWFKADEVDHWEVE